MINSGKDYPFIKGFTIDPNEYCNAKCWFCVNKYKQSKANILSIDKFEIIIDKILKERGNIVEENLNTVYMHQFNEILLYPYFNEMLELFRKKHLKTSIFSNGTNLTPEKYNKILDYNDVITDIMLNVPSIERETWKNHTSLDDDQFDKLINNLDYINNNVKDTLRTIIGVNGVSDRSYFENGGFMTKLCKFPINIKDDIDIQFDLIKKTYTNFNSIVKNEHLSDWGGYLENHEIYSLSISNLIKNKKENNIIVDCLCNHRNFNYLEINSNGDVYLCLDDVELRTKYGNLLEQDLNEIWNSDLRKQVIKKETTDGICSMCNLAVWKK
jgi:radical SAM protein with 4Fe4S-binding SPASM domain